MNMLEEAELKSSALIDLGDARFTTRGVHVLGPIEIQTLMRTYDAGIHADD